MLVGAGRSGVAEVVGIPGQLPSRKPEITRSSHSADASGRLGLVRHGFVTEQQGQNEAAADVFGVLWRLPATCACHTSGKLGRCMASQRLARHLGCSPGYARRRKLSTVLWRAAKKFFFENSMPAPGRAAARRCRCAAAPATAAAPAAEPRPQETPAQWNAHIAWMKEAHR